MRRAVTANSLEQSRGPNRDRRVVTGERAYVRPSTAVCRGTSKSARTAANPEGRSRSRSLSEAYERREPNRADRELRKKARELLDRAKEVRNFSSSSSEERESRETSDTEMEFTFGAKALVKQALKEGCSFHGACERAKLALKEAVFEDCGTWIEEDEPDPKQTSESED